jgi:putative hydrolase
MGKDDFNERVAQILQDCAELLRQQGANPFRVNAYQRAAETVRSLPVDVRNFLHDEGIEGLISLPFIGKGLADSIAEIARTGRLLRLDRWRGDIDPERLFQTVPGIGPALASAIHQALHVDTLEALEVAAHDGRLLKVPGVGLRRATAIRASLAAMLGRTVVNRRPKDNKAPTVEQILDVDREYREKATSGSLQTIAPKRFNPDGKSWLPILHTARSEWHFTALYSNTARSHELGRTYDWVVLYYYNDDHEEGQATVVTETHGPMKGMRVVRGREAECRVAAH